MLPVPGASAIQVIRDDRTEFSWMKALRWCPHHLLDLINSKACRGMSTRCRLVNQRTITYLPKGAIMFNDTLSLTQCEQLVRRLSGTAFPFQCAHGRSVKFRSWFRLVVREILHSLQTLFSSVGEHRSQVRQEQKRKVVQHKVGRIWAIERMKRAGSVEYGHCVWILCPRAWSGLDLALGLDRLDTLHRPHCPKPDNDTCAFPNLVSNGTYFRLRTSCRMTVPKTAIDS